MDPVIALFATAAGLAFLGYMGWAYADYRRMRGGRWW